MYILITFMYPEDAMSNKENKPLKRPFGSTYLNTLHVAKKLKPLTESPRSRSTEETLQADFILIKDPPSETVAMLNGHHSDGQYSAPQKAPIATLSNLGNTCFLNSVLYTLRYAPRFLHNLHHLVSDLASVEQKLGSIRLKSSSLGRSASSLAAPGARSWSSKDLLSLGQSDSNMGKSKIQIATEKLHETYLNLRAAESKCLNSNGGADSPEPYAADAFLAALRDVNSTFEDSNRETYLNLRAAESKCLNSNGGADSPEPYAADAFLAALRDVNSTFEDSNRETYLNLRAAESKCLNSNGGADSPEPYAADAFLAALRDVNSTFEDSNRETYLNLRAAESKCLNSNGGADSPEPYAADAFLAALRDVNSTFEGNRQQDAHELLVCILDNIRETCRALSARANRLQTHDNGDSNGINRQPSLDGDSGKPTLTNLRKSWKKRKEGKDGKDLVDGKERRASPCGERAPDLAPHHAPGWDFVADDFEGTMVVRTTCLECESVTEKAQAVWELCVPVQDDDPPSSTINPANPPAAAGVSQDEPFRAACLTAEYLRDQNKYWCERCLRHNEARRTVSYSRLPRLLVLQLKRFSGGMEKITRHAPTPRTMPCFCEVCTRRAPDTPPPHRYILWAVIMHLGQSLTGGHYVAYARLLAHVRAKRSDGGMEKSLCLGSWLTLSTCVTAAARNIYPSRPCFPAGRRVLRERSDAQPSQRGFMRCCSTGQPTALDIRHAPTPIMPCFCDACTRRGRRASAHRGTASCARCSTGHAHSPLVTYPSASTIHQLSLFNCLATPATSRPRRAQLQTGNSTRSLPHAQPTGNISICFNYPSTVLFWRRQQREQATRALSDLSLAVPPATPSPLVT
ncbi:ubiquitin carboxyl-terminal hydrolase domain-containing protein [Phthorimaea operculella]|nr:ubiquitin carboxyl-terminal hydrolase domain-containing protein [Phthorimaea operculella]